MSQYKKNQISEYPKYFNANEFFTKDEIKSLKKLNPELNNLLKITNNPNNNSNKNSYITVDNNKETKKLLISKKQFFSLIFEELKKYFEKEKNYAMSKVISLLINEMITISKIIQENQILNNFFTEIKNDKRTYFHESKKSFNLVRKFQPKQDINYKSENQFDNLIINGNNIFKHSNSKKGNIVKTSSSFYESNNFEKSKENNNNIYVNTENENTNINKKNINFFYYSMKKPKIFGKKKNNKNNDSKKNISNNKISNPNKNKSSSELDFINSNTEKKLSTNKNKICVYLIKKRLKFNHQKKEQKEKSFNMVVNTKKKMEDFSIINFVNSNSELFNNIETENFDIFILENKVGTSNVLPIIGYYIFNRLGFHDIMNYNKFESWCKKIDEGYKRANPYHTNIHAADVTQTCLIYLKLGKINEICNLTKISKCGLFLSCMCHDYKHPGVNNNYLKETKNLYALTYNDASILENMHISETFKLINSHNTYNIFDKVDSNTYKQFRKEMISCVLATDMAFHNNYVNFLKEKLDEIKNGKDNKNQKNPNDYQNYMNLLIHSADISNPTKPFDIYFKWAKLVVNEFYDQGDKEKKLGMACSCDRNKVTIYQSQLGFINYIELPYFSLFAELFPKLNFYWEELNKNKNKLISMEEEEKKKNEKIDLVGKNK